MKAEEKERQACFESLDFRLLLTKAPDAQEKSGAIKKGQDQQ